MLLIDYVVNNYSHSEKTMDGNDINKWGENCSNCAFHVNSEDNRQISVLSTSLKFSFPALSLFSEAGQT